MTYVKHVPSLLEWQPEAHHIRNEGKCPNCKRHDLVSYLLPGDLDNLWTHAKTNRLYSLCGFYCYSCGWANGGRRPTEVEIWD